MELEEKIRKIARDQLVCEYILSEFILENATVILLVLEQLSYAEQIMLKNIIQQLKNKNKKLLVIHNLMNLTSISEIEGFIKNTLLNSLTFKLEKYEMGKFKTETNTNHYYYRQIINGDSNLEISHFIFGNENDEKIRNYYNEPLIEHIRKFIRTGEQKKFDLIEKFKNFIIEQSIKISEQKLNESSLIYAKEEEKLKLVNIKELKLKGITHDEKGLHNFTGNAMELPYRTYFKNENSQYFFYIETEIYGEIKKEDIKIHIDNVKEYFIINLLGTTKDHINQSNNRLIKMDGNLHFDDFSLQIPISKSIILDKKESYIRQIDKVGDNKYDEKYGIYTIKFKISLLEKGKATTVKINV